MLMADTFAVFFVILGLLLAFPGLWLLCRGLWPNMVAGAADRCRKGLVKPILIGAPVFAGVIVFAIVVARVPGGVGAIISAAIICAFAMVSNAGVAGFATCIGERLASPADAARPWKSTLRGGIVLELSYLLPVLGWFVILPLSVIIGCGAAALSLMNLSRLRTPAGSGSVGSAQVSGLGA